MNWQCDWEAWRYLSKRGFVELKYVIHGPSRPLSKKEASAVDYLCDEWDWCYMGNSTHGGR